MSLGSLYLKHTADAFTSYFVSKESRTCFVIYTRDFIAGSTSSNLGILEISIQYLSINTHVNVNHQAWYGEEELSTCWYWK